MSKETNLETWITTQFDTLNNKLKNIMDNEGVRILLRLEGQKEQKEQNELTMREDIARLHAIIRGWAHDDQTKMLLDKAKQLFAPEIKNKKRKICSSTTGRVILSREKIDLKFNLQVQYFLASTIDNSYELEFTPKVYSMQSYAYPLNIIGLVLCWGTKPNELIYYPLDVKTQRVRIVRSLNDTFLARVFVIVKNRHFTLFPPYVDIEVGNISLHIGGVTLKNEFFLTETKHLEQEEEKSIFESSKVKVYNDYILPFYKGGKVKRDVAKCRFNTIRDKILSLVV
jgi:hypothetical protein